MAARRNRSVEIDRRDPCDDRNCRILRVSDSQIQLADVDQSGERARLLIPSCNATKMQRKKPSAAEATKGFKNPAIPTFTLVCTIIGSKSLTSVFGMGTGRTFPIWSPERHYGGYFTAAAPFVCLVVELHQEQLSRSVSNRKRLETFSTVNSASD